MIPAPYWVTYPDIVALAEATPVGIACPAESGFKLKPADLEAAITPQDQVADPELAVEPDRRRLYARGAARARRRAA